MTKVDYIRYVVGVTKNYDKEIFKDLDLKAS